MVQTALANTKMRSGSINQVQWQPLWTSFVHSIILYIQCLSIWQEIMNFQQDKVCKLCLLLLFCKCYKLTNLARILLTQPFET